MSNQYSFKVFLSHAETDYQLVYRIWSILSRLKVASYMHELYPDYRRDIPTGIRDVLRGCIICITFLTNEGINSQWVQQELGIAYAFNRIIVPVIEHGVQYKGFVQMVRKIPFEPTDPEQVIYEVIYAVRASIVGHNAVARGITLTCANYHEHDYILPSTHDLNEAIRIGQIYAFNCEKCGINIELDPKTLEIR